MNTYIAVALTVALIITSFLYLKLWKKKNGAEIAKETSKMILKMMIDNW